jgi:AAA+ ATPase superfamily predicted ATPase
VRIKRTATSKRFLLCLDEFERLSKVVKVTGSRTPLNFRRHVLQHRAAWTLLFCGSHEPKELPDYWSDSLINTRTLRVSYLDEESARELIVQPVEDFTNIYEPTAIDTIIHLTRCQPYLVQLTCYEVVELL